MTDLGRRFRVGAMSVLRRCVAVGPFRFNLLASALLVGCATTAGNYDPASLEVGRGVDDFEEAVLKRCLPAALYHREVNTFGLKELPREQVHSLIGDTKASAFVYGENAILVDRGRGACSVSVFVADHKALSRFPEQSLIADGASFRETNKPDKNTRLFSEPGGPVVAFSQYPNLTMFRAESNRRVAVWHAIHVLLPSNTEE